MIAPILSILLMVSCAGTKQNIYIGSTPADPVIKSFLGIPIADSVDFIRWKLIVSDNTYQLQCNYGISKPNTNGFINGGVKVELTGECRKDKNYYHFKNGIKTLKALELNEDLLHLLNTDNSLLVGNGGWSYTLNSTMPSGSNQVSLSTVPAIPKDSLSFEGRTPCKIPNVVAPGTLCYKLKWRVILYTNAQTNQPGSYKILGTPWRERGARTGNWKIITDKNGQTIYQLDDDKGNGFLSLLKLDENIVIFTDTEGKLLVGDEDFSYTLNREI